MSASFDPTADNSDPLASLNFSTLIDGAAKLRPARIALFDARGGEARNVSFERLAQQTAGMARAWRDLGLAAGERIVIAGNTSPASIIAMLGALRAGLDVALAPAHLDSMELAHYAVAAGAAALAGEPIEADLDIADAMFHAAAKAERVRIVATLGSVSTDGAVTLDPLAPVSEAQAAQADSNAHYARVITREADGACRLHRQRTIVAAALDFVTRSQIGTQTPIVSTIPPASFAGLVAGPIAALVAGAPFVLHAPFDAAQCMALIEALRPVHMIVPAALSEAIAHSRLCDGKQLATLVLLSRFAQMPVHHPEDSPESALPADVPVIDLYGIGEIAAVAELRLADGRRITPLAAQHVLNLDGRDVVAARRKLHYLAANGRLDTVVALEGAAISQGSEGEHE